MKELYIVIDYYQFTYDELKNYLLSLNGIKEVLVIDIDDLLRLDIKYDSNLITDNIIKLEILAFADLLKYPVIYEFDKYTKVETNTYEILRDSVCCEYCYSFFVDELYDTKGIEKVESNFYLKHFKRRYKDDKYQITIYYDPNKVSIEKLKELENDL